MPNFLKRLLVFLILFSNNLTEGINTASGDVKFSPGDASSSFTLLADTTLALPLDSEPQEITSTEIEVNNSYSENTPLAQVALPFTASDSVSDTFSPKDQTLNVTRTSYVYTYTQVVPVSTVPEPETYGMMLAGISLIVFMERRKNKT